MKTTPRGISGVPQQTLTAQTLREHAARFVASLPEPPRAVVLGRDARVSGAWVAQTLRDALVEHGATVLLLDITPFPAFLQTVRAKRAAGGIYCTASGTIEKNGCVFVDAAARVVPPARLPADAPPPAESPGAVVPCDAQALHLQALLARPFVRVDLLRRRRLRVVVDGGSGAGGPMMLCLLRAVGCECFPLRCAPTGQYREVPKVARMNVVALQQTVRKRNADFGVALSGDGASVLFVDEAGTSVAPAQIGLVVQPDATQPCGEDPALPDVFGEVLALMMRLAYAVGQDVSTVLRARGARRPEGACRDTHRGVGKLPAAAPRTGPLCPGGPALVAGRGSVRVD